MNGWHCKKKTMTSCRRGEDARRTAHSPIQRTVAINVQLRSFKIKHRRLSGHAHKISCCYYQFQISQIFWPGQKSHLKRVPFQCKSISLQCLPYSLAWFVHFLLKKEGLFWGVLKLCEKKNTPYEVDPSIVTQCSRAQLIPFAEKKEYFSSKNLGLESISPSSEHDFEMHWKFPGQSRSHLFAQYF